MARRKDIWIRARVDQDTKALMDHLCDLRGLSQSEILRQSLIEYHQRVTQEVQELNFLGSEEVQQLKHEAIELLRRRKGPAMVAREIGVTYREIKRWLEDDQLFAEFFEWARDETVEIVEHKMWLDAAENDKLSARFGFLNTHHEKWGLVSKDYLKREFTKFLEKSVIPFVQQHLSRDRLLEFTAGLRKLPREHLRGVRGGS